MLRNNDPILAQFKKNRQFFEVIKTKMEKFNNYKKYYNDTLEKLKTAVVNVKICNRNEIIQKLYKDVLKIMFDFFNSKEYLSTYNTAFLHLKNHNERDEVIMKIFELKPIDLDVGLYEILIYLLRKTITSEKFQNLQKLQKLILIQKRWREFLKSKDG